MGKSYLIDGYNLLHAAGWFPAQVGPHSLEKARGRLLAQLTAGHGHEAAVTIVFDSHHAPPNVPAVQHIRGVEVLFAVDYPEADDLLEELIQHHSSPRQLMVISDDHRIQQAGRRRHCQILGCADYLKQLPQLRARTDKVHTEAEKQDQPTESEKTYWKEQFRNLDSDPLMKDLFDPFDFGAED